VHCQIAVFPLRSTRPISVADDIPPVAGDGGVFQPVQRSKEAQTVSRLERRLRAIFSEQTF
jgi:hypothetical protein